jgi:hypothetical protein
VDFDPATNENAKEEGFILGMLDFMANVDQNDNYRWVVRTLLGITMH